MLQTCDPNTTARHQGTAPQGELPHCQVRSPLHGSRSQGCNCVRGRQ